MDHIYRDCDCRFQITVTMVTTVLAILAAGLYIVYLKGDEIVEAFKKAITVALENNTFGMFTLASELISLTKVPPSIALCKFTVNGMSFEHYVKLDTDPSDSVLTAKVYGVTVDNKTVPIPFLPGMNISVPAYFIDPSYDHYEVHIKGQVHTLDYEDHVIFDDLVSST